MKIQVGDYMVWHGSRKQTGEFAFVRPIPTGGYLEHIRTSDGDDKLYAEFLNSEFDFWLLARIIAETHGLCAKRIGPDEQAGFNILTIHPAARFIHQTGG